MAQGYLAGVCVEEGLPKSCSENPVQGPKLDVWVKSGIRLGSVHAEHRSVVEMHVQGLGFRGKVLIHPGAVMGKRPKWSVPVEELE
jgi:hypothetical protein